MRVAIIRLFWFLQFWNLVWGNGDDQPSNSSPAAGSGGGGRGGWGWGSPGKSSISSYAFWRRVPKATHYSTIGFPTPDNVDEHMDQMEQFVKDPATVMVPAFTKGYRMFHLACTKSGAELWGGANADNCFFGHDPHFSGPSRLRMKLTKKIVREYDECTFEGHAWPAEDHTGSGEEFLSGIQFDFDCPAYQLKGKDIEVPVICTVQVAAFAEEIQVFESMEEYKKFNQENVAKGMISFSDRCFAAASFWAEDEGDGEREKRRAKALMAGHVIQAEVKINEHTGESFYWLLVETVGGCQFDVVMHPKLLIKGPLRPGCIIHGFFFLSGRLEPDL